MSGARPARPAPAENPRPPHRDPTADADGEQSVFSIRENLPHRMPQ
jgi:hypothetical protein